MAIKNVAVVVSGVDEEYPYQIILGINKFAKEHNINISYFAAFGGIINSSEFDMGEFSIYSLPVFSDFDGVILLPNTFTNPEIRNAIIRKVKSSRIPSVIFESQDHEEFYDVSISNYAVMKKLVNHLIIEHGTRVFNFISGPESNPEAADRYRAFRDALEENEIEFDEENRLYKGSFRSSDGTQAIETFDSSGLSLPDAFVCANDNMALAAMKRLQQKGYTIPDDVIVTGFDNIFKAQNSSPLLTTVKRPLYYSGERACSILWNLMNGIPENKSTPIDAEPVFTESCGCPADEFSDIKDFQRHIYTLIERLYTNIHMLNKLIAGLAEAENISDCIEALEKMLSAIGCDNFSLCLVKNWESTYNTIDLEKKDASYPPELTAPYILENGKKSSVDSFQSRQLRPVSLAGGGNISYYIPLHYGRRCLGYYIMTNNDFPINSMICHATTMCLSYTIDNISKLNVLDHLCKIYNRRGFNKNAEYIFNECVSSGDLITICFIDMDGLKNINDTYGHKEGDFALKCIANTISSSCASGDICGRYGGDEFIVLGKGEGFIERFEREFERKIAEINRSSNKPYTIAASLGYVSAVPEHDDQLLELIHQADEKMYKIKKAKRGDPT